LIHLYLKIKYNRFRRFTRVCLVFPPFLSLWFLVSSFNIYLNEYWALVFFIYFRLDFHWFWKWYELSYSSTLDCLIIKLHSFIQFPFDEVVQYHNQVTDFVCWPDGIEWGFFQNFFEIIFCLQFILQCFVY
jgi:hypothetical protein